MAVAEMGYRAKRFHQIMDRAEAAYRTLLGIPDGYEVHFMNGGATLQARPLTRAVPPGGARGPSRGWSTRARTARLPFDPSRPNQSICSPNYSSPRSQ